MALDILLPSAVRSGSGQSATVAYAQDVPLRAELDVSASSVPTTLNVRVQHSSDGGTTWYTIGAFTQVGAVSTARESIAIAAPHSGMIRIDFTVVGTSYTFSVTLRRN